MKIKVEQAIFGYNEGRHRLVQSTLPKDKISSEIVDFADLPSTHPSDVGEIPPYISGMPFQDYYVFTKTFLIKGARGGGVFTHGLLIEKSQISNVVNLNKLFEQFAIEPDFDYALSRIDVDLSKENNFVNYDALPTVAHHLLNGESSLVWVGFEDITEIIVQLWSNLLPQFRGNFSFHLSLTPNDIQNYSTRVIFIPDEIKGSYRDFDIVKKDTFISKERTISERLLLGEDDGVHLLDFIQSLGIHLTEIQQLKRIEEIYRDFKKLERLNLNETRGLAGSIAYYSKSKNKGQQIKSKVLNRLQEKILHEANPTLEDIDGLYNLKYESFSDDKSIIEPMIINWFEKQLVKVENLPVKDFYSMFCNALKNEPNKKDWSKGIRKGLVLLFKENPKFSSKLIWDLFLFSDESVGEMTDLVDVEMESFLTKNIPQKIKSGLSEQVRNLCVSKNWYVLHATVLCKSDFPFVKVLQQQIEFEQEDDKGLQQISKLIPAKDFIINSVEFNDDRLINLCTNLIIKNNKLIRNIDIKNEVWQIIWLKYINETNDVFDAFKRSNQQCFDVLDLLTSGESINPKLIEEISKTSHCDLSEYSNRKRVWQYLIDKKVRDRFLEQTTKGVLDKQTTLSDIEYEIIQKILSSRTLLSKYFESYPIGKIIALFQNHSQLDERQFLDFISRRNKDFLSRKELSDLGTLIRSKKWKEAANKIYDYASGNPEWIIALNECSDLLGWLKRIRVAKWGVSDKVLNLTEKDKVKMVVEAARNLVSEDKPKEALELLGKLDRNHGIKDDIREISAKLTRIEREKNKGLIDTREADAQHSQVNNAILKLINLLEGKKTQLSGDNTEKMDDYNSNDSKKVTPSASIPRRTILFLSANPKDTSFLRLDEEMRKIKDTLEASTRRDDFKFESEPAVKISTITKAMSKYSPQIVHFSGHGEHEGVMVEEDSGNSILFPIQGLKKLFKLYKEGVKCVILNACYSEQQASIISKFGIYVVGMNTAVSDKGAIAFSTGFYQSIGEGKNYEDAFQIGLVNISLYREMETPKLWLNGKELAIEE